MKSKVLKTDLACVSVPSLDMNLRNSCFVWGLIKMHRFTTYASASTLSLVQATVKQNAWCVLRSLLNLVL